MKTKLIACFFAVVMLMAFSSVSMADQINNGDVISLQNGAYGTTSGGTFKVYKSSSYLFDTFCLELSEHISYGSSYFVAIGNEAINGGGGPHPDPLDIKTAFLYYGFRTNTLLGFNKNSDADINSLQYAIWSIEQEQATTDTKALALIALAGTSNWTGIGNVRVMNLYSYDSNKNRIENQSLLTLVPEPASMLLFGLGLLGLAGLRRRFKK